MKHVKKVLSMMLVMCMLLSLVPTVAFAAGEEDVKTSEDTDVKKEETGGQTDTSDESSVMLLDTDARSADSEVTMDTIEKEQDVSLNTENLYKIYHLDCGRKYFSVEQIKEIIDVIAKNNYNALELAIGNDGMRFLLNDMTVEANGTTYSSEKVTEGIQNGNQKYYNCGTNELTETDMDTIITYANGKGISIIPLVNTPGHMDAILTAANSATGVECSYNGSSRTIDVTNATAVNFTLALVNKYIQYFAGKGCTIFNMGCDEYANDIYSSGSMGFGNLVSAGQYSYFINYVNNMAAQVQNAGMTPMAFNDGFYFNGNTSSGTFDRNIVIAFWSRGWPGYTLMSAADLADKGHKIINTNGDWYYILGNNNIDTVVDQIKATPYNSVMGSNTMNVAGCMLCSWCDTPSKDYSETEKANFVTQISTFATSNVDVFDVKSEETITVVAGGTATKNVSGANYAGDYETADPSIATVEVTGTNGSDATVTYTKVNSNPNWNTLISSNTTSATSYYYLASDGNYYQLYVTREAGSYYLTYNYSLGYYANDSSTLISVASVTNVWSFTAGAVDSSVTLYTKSDIAGEPASSTIVVTAAEDAAGKTTTVTIGNTIYTINVVAEDLSNVSDLKIEYWITNGRPTDSDDSNEYSIDAELEDVNSEEGIVVGNVLPENTKKENRTLQYWRCRLLDKTLTNSSTSGTQEQTETAGDDETYNGIEFTKVRYWKGNWSVYTEKNEWVDVSTDYQLVAYYLEILPISDELTVTAADWGKKGDGSTSGDYLDPSSSCTVSVQVVYEDGTTNPASTTAEDLKSCTIAYGYWTGGRGVGTLNLSGLEGYQIWKVEAETGSETYASSSSTWGSYTVNSFTWDNNAMTVYEGDPVDSYTIHNDANNPSTDSYYTNLMWDENYEAILIKVYVKAKPTDDNLTVIYHDEKFGDDLYAYSINVNNGVTFDNITPTPSEFVENAERIDVTGCGIENILGVTQKFQTDLTKVPEAVGKYSSDLYKYTGSKISEDKKTLYLYYTIDTDVLSPMFVIDYGRSFSFDLSQVVRSTETVTNVSVVEKTRYGTLSYNAENQKFTYTPTEVLPNIDVLTINITFDGAASATTTNAGVMPATTINYEEGFATLNGFTGETKGTEAQNTQIAGQSTDNYGYDNIVVGESNNAASASAKGSTASLSFTGTGVDLYVNSTKTSGNIAIQVRDSEGSLVKLISVKTTSNSSITNAYSGTDQNGLIAASVRGLTYGSYSVKITTTSNETVYFDGFRVYGTISDQGNDYYLDDKEDNPVFLELRDYVLTAMDVDNTSSSASVYAQVREKTDGQLTSALLDGNTSDSYTAQELLDNGPKNELFLLPGQSVTFKLTTNREVQLGMKAVNGTATVTGTYNGTISTDKDMFYTVAETTDAASEKTITICNDGSSESILSITKVKICDDPNAAFAELDEDDFNDALIALGLMEEPELPVVEADANLNISVVDYSGAELASTSLTATGAEGEENVFVAADILEAAKAVLPDGYAFADEAAVTDQSVAYGADGTVTVQAGKVATLNVTYKKLFGKSVGTATLTKVQTSGSSKASFTASDIRAAAPEGYTVMTLLGTSVKYGSSGTKTVYVY